MDESTSIPASEQLDFIGLTTEIVTAYVSKNSVRPGDMPALLADVHAALAGLNGAHASDEPKAEKPTPAQIRKSVKPDALISFIDGKPYKTLKRHLTGNGMTFDEYRQRYGLPLDYPSVAASYSAQRAEYARITGLGQRRQKAAPKTASVAATISETPKASGRKKAVETADAPAEKPVKARKSKKAAAVE